MSDNTHIQWCDASWPVSAGCDDVSPGCLNCYAKRDSHRLGGNPHPEIRAAYGGTTDRRAGGPIRWTGLVRPLPGRLDWPLRWQRPRRIFVGNESDLFHESIPNEYIAAVFAVMAVCPAHTFQVLTKRAARLPDWFAWVAEWKGGYLRGECGLLLDHLRAFVGSGAVYERAKRGLMRAIRTRWPSLPDPSTLEKSPFLALLGPAWPLPNVWIGVSVEDQQRADERIPDLLKTPAAVRFLSCEPLIADIDLAAWLSGLSWVIVGGESTERARPMHLAWARAIRDQCTRAGVPCFVKQLGSVWARDHENGCRIAREAILDSDAPEWADPWIATDAKGGDIGVWPEDLRVRQFPEA